ncbi:MAG: class I SAM-dependent methyltransferase [Acidobacteria bacterium]|jgi:ubiquinone/menaquinone biosynthesis C-methylase UbiE|nr:class I SAM-dependent methyltransferase [Acidobacteriota bacterium]
MDKSSLILDLGCGSGTYLRLLRSEGFHRCIGMDYAQNMLAHARKRDDTPGLRYHCDDIYSMPFKDEGPL